VSITALITALATFGPPASPTARRGGLRDCALPQRGAVIATKGGRFDLSKLRRHRYASIALVQMLLIGSVWWTTARHASQAHDGKAVRAIDEARQALGLPASTEAGFQGTTNAVQASLTNASLRILAALVTVSIMLGVLSESSMHPLTMLSPLPSVGGGALLALLLCYTDLSVIVLIGMIVLIGIVHKNGIMMIDVALDAERREGTQPLDAIWS
jgi:multidrug efflux pump subunit AcrB